MSLDEKIKDTLEFIAKCFAEFQRPVLLWSGGKDSMVLLYLLKSMKRIPPVLFFEEPKFPRKFAFAHRIIESLNLEVHDYPPVRMSMLYGKNGIPSHVAEYHTGSKYTIILPRNIIEYEDGDREYLCGLEFLSRPTTTYPFPWDLLLIGHKDVDEDQIFGRVPLKTRTVVRDEGPAYAFPLKNWTHDDVWDYTDSFGVPVQQSRYDQATRTEWKIKYYNSDYFPLCIRCVDARRAGTQVSCPRFERSLVNISEQVRRFDEKLDYLELEEGYANTAAAGGSV
jgi:3'-phosphoadenosine 5'-phosphosulfate sulfotransferase (PAPS reductase)/FAD synthetase